MNPTPQSAALAEEIAQILNGQFQVFNYTDARAFWVTHFANIIDSHVRPLVEALEKIQGNAPEENRQRADEIASAALATEPSGAKEIPKCTCTKGLSYARPSCPVHGDSAGNVPPEPRVDNEATPETEITNAAREAAEPLKNIIKEYSFLLSFTDGQFSTQQYNHLMKVLGDAQLLLDSNILRMERPVAETAEVNANTLGSDAGSSPASQVLLSTQAAKIAELEKDKHRLEQALDRVAFFFAGTEHNHVAHKILLVLGGKTIEEAIAMTPRPSPSEARNARITRVLASDAKLLASGGLPSRRQEDKQ